MSASSQHEPLMRARSFHPTILETLVEPILQQKSNCAYHGRSLSGLPGTSSFVTALLDLHSALLPQKLAILITPPLQTDIIFEDGIVAGSSKAYKIQTSRTCLTQRTSTCQIMGVEQETIGLVATSRVNWCKKTSSI